MAATASYKAVPSMFIVAPIGVTNLITRSSILLFTSRHSMVTGNVAELKKQHHAIQLYVFKVINYFCMMFKIKSIVIYLMLNV